MNQQKVVNAALLSNVPLVLRGQPGVGKTSYFRAVAKEMNAYMLSMIASIHTPEDFGGIPFKTGTAGDERVEFATPGFAKNLNDAANNPEYDMTLFFCDEINTAPPAVQAPLLSIILDRKVGDFQMSPDIRMIAAMNPPETSAGGGELTPPLANRFTHVDFEPDAQEWAMAFLSNFRTQALPQLPESYDTDFAGMKGLVSGYIQAHPEALLSVPEDETELAQGWPSPRSWENTTKMIAVYPRDKDAVFQIAKSTIGNRFAGSFLEYFVNADLPDPKTLLEMGHITADRSDKVYAGINAAIAYTVSQNDTETLDKCWQLVVNTMQDHATDVAVAAANRLLNATKGVIPDPEGLDTTYIPQLGVKLKELGF